MGVSNSDSRKALKALVIIFWLITFFVLFGRVNFFSYRDSPATGKELLSSTMRDLEKPLYSEGYTEIMVQSNNSLLVVELVPNSSTLFDGLGVRLDRITHININSRGLRDYEYTVEKPEDVFRIIVLGDSFTFGQGVELNETYLKILERKINALPTEEDYEVLNFGVPGYHLSTEAEQFKVKALRYSPDLIIVGVTLSNEFKENYHSSHRLDCIHNQEWCNSKIEQPLREFYDTSSSEGVPVVIAFLIPYSAFYEEGHELLKKLSEKHGFYYLQVDYSNRAATDPLPFVPRDGHPSPSGHRIIADSIHEYLVSYDLL